MLDFNSEKRKKRSNVAQLAIQFQLESVAKKAKFSSVVLADELGLVMEAVGDSSFADEMAAISPGILKKKGAWRGKILTSSGKIMKLTFAAVNSIWGSLFLCAAGGDDSIALDELNLGGLGVVRILA